MHIKLLIYMHVRLLASSLSGRAYRSVEGRRTYPLVFADP